VQEFGAGDRWLRSSDELTTGYCPLPFQGREADMSEEFDEMLSMLGKDPKAFFKRFGTCKRVLKIRGIHNETLLHYCSIEGMDGAVDVLLRLGCSPNVRSRFGSTPLMDASLNGHEAIVKKLLLAGADVEARDNIGYTVLEKLSLLEKGENILKLIKAVGKEKRGR
jgi:hypothetical protein